MPIHSQTNDTCPPSQETTGHSDDHPADPLDSYYAGMLAIQVDGQEIGWSFEALFPANDTKVPLRHERRREARVAKKEAKRAAKFEEKLANRDVARLDFDLLATEVREVTIKVEVPCETKKGRKKVKQTFTQIGAEAKLSAWATGTEVVCPIGGHGRLVEKIGLDGQTKRVMDNTNKRMHIVRKGRQAYCDCDGRRVVYLASKLERTPDSLQAHVVLHAHDLKDGTYIPEWRDFGRLRPDGSYGSVAMKAGLGRGKSTWGAAAVERLKEAGATRIVALAPTVSLVDGLANDYGLLHYQKAEEWELWSGAVCLPSFERVKLYANGQKLPLDGLFLDEVSGMLQALVTGAMTDLKSQEVMRHLCTAIRTAEQVFAFDGHLSQYEIDFINALRPHDPLTVVRVAVPEPWEYVATGDEEAWYGEVEAACKRREILAIPCNSRKAGHRIEKMIEMWWPEARIVVLNSRTVGTLVDPDDKKSGRLYDLANWEWLRDVDVLIYSPSLASGVSIDLKGHFERIFGHFQANILTAQGCHQMLHRVRSPRSKRIVVYVEGRACYLPTDPAAIRAEILTRGRITLRRATKAGKLHHTYTWVERPRWDTDGTPRTDAEAQAYLDHVCHTVAWERRNGLHGPAAAFRRLLDGLDLEHPWMDLMTDQTEEEAKEKRAQKKAAEVVRAGEAREALLSADGVPIDVVWEREATGDPQEILENERAYLVDFYLLPGEDLPHSYAQPNPDDPDADRPFAHALLQHDEAPDGRDKTRALADFVLLGQDPGAAERALLAQDWRAYVRGCSPAGLQHRYMKANMRAQFLGWYGLGLTATVDDDGGWAVLPTVTDCAHKQAERAAVAKAQTRAKDAGEEPPDEPDPSLLCLACAKAIAVPLARQHAAELKLWLGITVRKNIEADPFRLLLDGLKKLGLALGSKQRRVESGSDERVRDKWLDPHTLDLGVRFARGELRRLRAAADRVAADTSAARAPAVTAHPDIDNHWSAVTPQDGDVDHDQDHDDQPRPEDDHDDVDPDRPPEQAGDAADDYYYAVLEAA